MPITNVTRSDLLIMTLKNSLLLIKKYGSLLLLKILARSVSLSLLLPGLVTGHHKWLRKMVYIFNITMLIYSTVAQSTTKSTTEL